MLTYFQKSAATLPTRTTRGKAARKPDPPKDASTTTPVVESNAAASAPNSRKHGRKDDEDEDEDDSGSSSDPKRARKDGEASDKEDDHEEPEGISAAHPSTQRDTYSSTALIHVQQYIAERTQEIKAETQRLGRLVPPDTLRANWKWETDTRDKGEKIRKLIRESKLLSLVDDKLTETEDLNEEIIDNEDRRFLTRAGICAWTYLIYDGLCKTGKEKVDWIVVDYPPDTPPEGENLHTTMPDGSDYELIDPGQEFAWNVWTPRTSFIQEPKDQDVPAYWIDGPGLTNEPFDRQIIAYSKNTEINRLSKRPESDMGESLREFMIERKDLTRRANEGDKQAIKDLKDMPSLTWAPDAETTEPEPSQSKPRRGMSSTRVAKAAAKKEIPWSEQMKKWGKLLKPKDPTRTAGSL